MRRLLLLVVALSILAGTGFAFAQDGRSPSLSPRKLVVAVVNDPPMVMKDEKGRWKGFSVDLWSHVAKDLGAAYEFKEMPFKEIESALGSGEADLCIAPVYETVDRLRFLDFSTTMGATQPAIAVLATKDEHPILTAIKVFVSWGLVEMALLFLLILVAAGTAFWIMERKHNPESFGGNPLKGISAGIYWVGATLVSGICTGVSIKSTLGRLMGLVWILAGAVVFSALTAALASSLIERQQTLTYTYDMNAIRRMHLGAIAGTTQAGILDKTGGNYTLFEKTDEGMDALFAKKIDGFLGSERIMRYEGARYKGKLSVHPTTLKKRRFAFAFPKDSPLRVRVNVSVMAFMEKPEWDAMANRWGLSRDLEPLPGKGSEKGLWAGK